MRRVLAGRVPSYSMRLPGAVCTLTISILACAALAALAAAPAGAATAAGKVGKAGANLLTNPNFDTGLTGWNPIFRGVWDPAPDAEGNPASGSLQLASAAAGACGNADQCVPVGPGTYELSGKVFAPVGAYAAGSAAFLLLQWHGTADCSATLGEVLSSELLVTATQDRWVRVTTGAVTLPPGTRSALVSAVVCTRGDSTGTATANFDDLVFAQEPGGCVPGPTTLCLDDVPGDRRFSVVVSFETSQGGGLSGSGEAIPLASLGVTRAGLIWFFSADNPEMLIKVINGCSVNQNYWTFFSALTNAGFTVRLTDTVTGRSQTYFNQDLNGGAFVQDTSSLLCN